MTPHEELTQARDEATALIDWYTANGFITRGGGPSGLWERSFETTGRFRSIRRASFRSSQANRPNRA